MSRSREISAIEKQQTFITTNLECFDCHGTGTYRGDSSGAAEYFWKDGWRVKNKQALCAGCLKKHNG